MQVAWSPAARGLRVIRPPGLPCRVLAGSLRRARPRSSSASTTHPFLPTPAGINNSNYAVSTTKLAGPLKLKLKLTTDTGGRAYFPAEAKSLASVYGQIYDELSSQYTIGYTSKNPKRDGAWRRLVVRISRPNAQARTKQGYFAPTR